jgi:molybdate transport system substrate-binding protein
MRASTVRAVAALVMTGAMVAALLTACASSGSSHPSTSAGGPGSGSSPAVTGTITVLAAASLTEAFTTLGRQFEAAHPGAKVVFSFGPSSGLATQITQGAPADVFASASPKNMDQVTSAGAASSAIAFAKNTMEIAVPPSNPAAIASVSDLARKNVKVALCQAQVPCGTVAQQVFANAKVTVTPVTQEADVKSVLAKVQLGEVDAGVVYVTDVRAAGDKVKGIAIPPEVNASTAYPIAALSKAPNAAGGRAFVDYVLSPAGMSVLTQDGFSAP